LPFEAVEVVYLAILSRKEVTKSIIYLCIYARDRVAIAHHTIDDGM
jgi:hypothetical protein